MDTAELILCNWEVVAFSPDDPESTSGINDQDDDQGTSNLRCVWRFLASPDEEWYRAVHIVLHYEARDVVAAIRKAHVAMHDHNDLGTIRSMKSISNWLHKVCDYFDAHFDSKDSRTEQFTMQRMQQFHGWDLKKNLSWEETACWVYFCGSSILIPILHSILGIGLFGFSPQLMQEGGWLLELMQQCLKESRVCMPRPHRLFLEELEKHGNNFRFYCYSRFGHGVPEEKSVSVEMLHNLETNYNDLLNALVRFLSRRVHLVSRMVPCVAGPLGQLHAKAEEAMQLSRLQLLLLRQRVDQRIHS